MGTDTPQSSQSKSSGLISSHDYGMNNPEPDYEEAKPAKIPKMEITPQNFTRTGRQIRVPARSREEGYEVGQTHEDQKQEEEYEDTVIDVPALPGLAKIAPGAEYKSWSDFERAFTHWKDTGKHPMRVASSETMKDLNGIQNPTYRYKYVTYHCAHYGVPRMRGNGLRQNQSYQSCGCHSMLRLIYSFESQTLRVSCMTPEHNGHARDRQFYEKIAARLSAAKNRSGTANYINSAASSPAMNSPMVQSPFGTPANGDDEKLKELLGMLTATNQATMQLLQQSQGGAIPNLASILGPQLGALGILPGIGLQGAVQQADGLLEDLKRQQQERMGTDTPQSSQSKSSGLISSHDYGMNNPEPDYEEAKPAKIPKMEITPQNFTRTGRQIRVPARSREEGYEVGQTHEDQKQEEEYEDTVIDVPALPGLAKIAPGAEYKSWSDFERAFTHWKDTGKHPMRVASSETMKDLNGIQNPTYRYKYVTYHCAHYGVPRMRGNGLRQNQSYQSCGCHSMLRLIYSFESQTLRVSCMTPEHNGHARDRQFYEKIAARLSAAKNRSGTANYINSAASSPAMNSPMVQSPFGTPANGDDEKLKELLGMLTATNQATMQLLQQSQGGAIPNLASILGPQLGALGILPGIGLQGAVQQADGTVRDLDNNINQL